MYTPNDQGYYQPYNPEGNSVPQQDQYEFPYQPPPPPPLETSFSNGSYNQNNQPNTFEMQNINQESVKNFQQKDNFKMSQKNIKLDKFNEVIDEYTTPTRTGEEDDDSGFKNQLYKISQFQDGLNKKNYNQSESNQYLRMGSQNINKSLKINIMSGVLKLQELEGIYIKQKLDMLERVSGCEKPNSYKVYPADSNGDIISGNYIFKCKERSNCCSRNFLPGSRRPFNMVVKNKYGKISQNQDGAEYSNFLHLRRAFKCTFLCISRPELEVIITENGINKLLGTITQPLSCCSVYLQIKDLSENVKYVISGNSCCMPSVFCHSMPCQACQQATFFIKDRNGEILSHITKRAKGCMKSCASDVSNFGVSFPPLANPEDKVLLMAATLFLDYIYFEESNADRHDENSFINYANRSENQSIKSSIHIPLNNIN